MNVEDWAAVAGVLVSLLAVGGEHLWVQNRIGRIERSQEFRTVVEQPIEGFEKVISDLCIDVEEWGLGRGGKDLLSLRTGWIRASRDLNRLINKLANCSDFQPSGGWLKVSTDEVDEAFSQLSDVGRTLLSQTTRRCLDRLGKSLSDALQEARPN